MIGEAFASGYQGMADVAQTVVNRAATRNQTLGEVVRAPSQYSGYDHPGSYALQARNDPQVRAVAEQALNDVLDGTAPNRVGIADHFHATSISPGWASHLSPIGTYDGHSFYSSPRAESILSAPATGIDIGLVAPIDTASYDAMVSAPVAAQDTPDMASYGLAPRSSDNEIASSVDIAGSRPDMGRRGLGYVDATPGYASPVGVDGTIMDTVGYRSSHPVTGTAAFHTGTDIAGAQPGSIMGAPAQAVQAGTVTSAGWKSGYGNTVDISHLDGTTTRYGHLDSISVKPGQEVTTGEEIGQVGSTGRSNGPHMHFEQRDKFGNLVDNRYSPALADIGTPQTRPADMGFLAGVDINPAIDPMTNTTSSLPGVDITPATMAAMGIDIGNQQPSPQGAMPQAAPTSGIAEAIAPQATVTSPSPGLSIAEKPAMPSQPSARQAEVSSMQALEAQKLDDMRQRADAAMASLQQSMAEEANAIAQTATQMSSTPVQTSTIPGNVNEVSLASMAPTPADRIAGAFDAVSQQPSASVTPSSRVADAFDTMPSATPSSRVANAFDAMPAQTTSNPLADTVQRGIAAGLADNSLAEAFGAVGLSGIDNLAQPSIEQSIANSVQSAIAQPTASIQAPQTPSFNPAQQVAVQTTAQQQQQPVAANAVASPSTPSSQPGIAGALGMDSFVPGVAQSVVDTANASSMNAPASGAHYGYSPFGGVATVYGNAPEHVQVAATGPGLFGFLGTKTSDIATTAANQANGLLSGISGFLGSLGTNRDSSGFGGGGGVGGEPGGGGFGGSF